MKFLSQINVNTEYTLPMVDGTNGQVLSTDGNGVAYWGTISASSLTLDGLSDVIITSPATGQILRYGIPVGSGEVNPVWHNVTPNFLTPSSSINALNDVVITTAATGQILQYNGTAWVNATLSTVEYVSKVQHIVKAGVAITKGQAVYVTGSDGTNMIVGLASNTSEGASSKTMGLAASTAAINAQIFVVTEGLLAGLNTSTATAGDPVWLGANGNLIFGLLNKPTSPAHLVYIGVVTRVQQNNGEIFVNVQNGIEIDEIHDIQISSPSTGQLLRRDSDGYWKNWTPNFLTSLPAHTHDDRYYTESEIDAFFGGETEIDGYNRGAWDVAYNDKINSVSFSTTTGVLTLTQQDTGTITVDLDGRYLESLPAHTHTIANVTGLQTALDGKAESSHIHDNATTLVSGFMSRTDKTKLDGIETSANNYSLPTATSTVLGGIKVGSNLSISSGVLSATDTDTVTSVGIVGDVSTGDIVLKGSGATTITKSGGTITISSTDTDTNTTYSAGTGLTLTGTTFSVTSGTYLTAETDTLATVTARGNSTTTALYLAGGSAEVPALHIRSGGSSWSEGLAIHPSTNSGYALSFYRTRAAYTDQTNTWAIGNLGDSGYLNYFGLLRKGLTGGVADRPADAIFTVSPTGTFKFGFNPYVGTNLIWHSGNDGDGSGLDADSVDGVHASNIVWGNAKGTNDSVTTDADGLDKTGFYTSGGFVTRPEGVDNWMYIQHIKLYNNNTQYQKQIGYDTYDDSMWVRTKSANTWSTWKPILTSENIGSYALTSLPAHTHTIANVTGLQTALDGKAASSHTHAASDITSGTLSTDRLPKQELGISIAGNFGQWQIHSTYTNFNTEVAYWGWNYVQGNTNAPHQTSSQWYRGRFSLGSEYGFGGGGEDYWLEIAIPRYSQGNNAGNLFVRTAESGVTTAWQGVRGAYSTNAGYAVSSGNSSTTDQTDFNTLSIQNRAVATEDFVTSQGYTTGDYLPLTGGTLTGAVVVNLGNVSSDTVAFKVGGPANYDSLTIGMEDTPDYDAFIASYGNDIRFYSGKGLTTENHSFYWFTSKIGTSQHSVVAMQLDHNQNLTIGGTFTEQSSIRYKENVKSIPSVSQKVEQLDAVSYNKIGSNQEEIGLIAEDVAELFPEVVKYDNEGRPDGVNYSRLSVILLKAVQELSQEVNELKKKLN